MMSKEKLLMVRERQFNLQRSRITSSMMLLISVLTLFSCIIGIINKGIYEDLLPLGEITQLLVFGSRGQDIIFIPLAVLLAVLSVIYLCRPSYKIFIIMIGLTVNFLYGYGLYVMQGQYTSIYLIYLVIFSLSIYSIVFGLLSFKNGFAETTLLPNGLRKAVSIFLYTIVFILGSVWLIRIMPDIAKHIPQDTYGVFVLDLGIVFPAIAIIATKLIRRNPFGNILAGVALVKVFAVCLSWGFTEWYGRIKGVIEGSYDMLVIPSVLTFIGLVFIMFYLLKLKTSRITD